MSKCLQFESRKYLHQALSGTLKYFQNTDKNVMGPKERRTKSLKRLKDQKLQTDQKGQIK